MKYYKFLALKHHASSQTDGVITKNIQRAILFLSPHDLEKPGINVVVLDNNRVWINGSEWRQGGWGGSLNDCPCWERGLRRLNIWKEDFTFSACDDTIT